MIRRFSAVLTCVVAFVGAILSTTTSVQAQTLNLGNVNLATTPVPGSGHDYIKFLNETVNPANGSVSLRIEAPVPKQRGDVNFPYYVFGYDSGGVSQPTGTIIGGTFG